MRETVGGREILVIVFFGFDEKFFLRNNFYLWYFQERSEEVKIANLQKKLPSLSNTWLN